MKKLFFTLAVTFAASTIAGITTRIEFEAPEAYPEGIAFDAKANVYYVSSARMGTIGKVTPDGQYSALYKDAGLKSSYGLKMHPDGKRLFACISDANYSKLTSPDTKKKMIRLISIDVRSGKKLSDVDLSGLFNGKHFGNDLTFDNKGNAYVTDSFSNVIYKVDSKGKASLFAQSDMFKTAGVGLNGIAWNPDGYLLVDSSGAGCIFKIEISNPTNITRVKTDKFFLGADGLLMNDKNTLTLVQNGGTNVIYQIQSTDGWKSATVKSATMSGDRFTYPSTATANKKDIWIMNAKFNELNDSTSVPSKKFAIQKAVFQPVK